MMKRGIIQLGGATPKFRISRKGVDVDLAGPTDFLLHEDYLTAQPYYAKFVPCPFAGNTSASGLDQTVPVTGIPNVTSDPIVVSYVQASDGSNTFPIRRSNGGPVGGRTDAYYFVFVTVVSATQLNVRFQKAASSNSSPNGVYIVLYRRAS